MPPRRRLHDQFFRRAKEEGYAARSAYKLREIQQRFALMRAGDRVIDLGCAPGSWLQVAGEFTGPAGRVVGVDLQPVAIPLPAHVTHFVADVFSLTPAEVRRHAGLAPPERFHAVLSDMAPNTSGHGDHFLSVRLCRRVLDLVPGLLAPGGSLAMKVFEGEEYMPLLRDVQRVFASARGFKPAASRDVSREIYIVARGYSGPVLSSDAAAAGAEGSP